MSRLRILVAALVACACVPIASAQAGETVKINASFKPDVLGAPTNVLGGAVVTSTDPTTVPSPLTRIVIKGPAGTKLDLTGVGICKSAAALQSNGPSACPKSSRAGFGKGIGQYQLGTQINDQPFTLDLFRGPNQGHTPTLLIYLNATSPVSVQIVFTAPITKQAKPYGLGFSFNVPLIATLPGASNASLKSATITIGAANAAYYTKVHGKRKLQHVKGIILPKKCPAGGFPVATDFSFLDGQTVHATSTVPCPKKKKK
ncbi:MAG TPA: hypothetical protein VLJ42_08070 [Solirubrobacteraceae bacterium]|nr:hypothetical protein [Solirubrobacteraceae bacterium]